MGWFGKFRKPKAETLSLDVKPEIPWLSAGNNPWGVPVLDLRPFTLKARAGSTVAEHAVNAVSFYTDDGTGFIGLETPVSRTVQAGLVYRIDRMLVDGSLFLPKDMDQMWAVFFHQNKILFVRSWSRQLKVTAEVQSEGNEIVVTKLHGTFTSSDEDPEFSVRILDYLLRSHALGMEHPVPLQSGTNIPAEKIAQGCFELFGNLAHFATPHKLTVPRPDVPLRSYSLLHIAAARGNLDQAKALLDAGVPADLIGRGGLTPLHWSLHGRNEAVHLLLLNRAASSEFRSISGATPLMSAVERKLLDQARFLLDHGVGPNVADDRGFTALHRAANMGELDLVLLLLERGAHPSPDAQGHTPRSLAEARGHTEVLEALSRMSD